MASWGGWESDDFGLSSDSEAEEEEEPRSSPGVQEPGQPWQSASRAAAGAASGGGCEDASPGEEAGGSSDSQLVEYARSLGVDLAQAEDGDLRWVVKEAFEAPLPSSWTAHLYDEGRVYFFNHVSKESSWSHPMDAVFKEVIQLIKATRAAAATGGDGAEAIAADDAQGTAGGSRSSSGLLSARQAAVQSHLEQVHRHALVQIEAWSGPYASEAGPYFYNSAHDASSWENPILEWQEQLLLRQRILHKCLIEDPRAASLVSGSTAASSDKDAPLEGEGGGAELEVQGQLHKGGPSNLLKRRSSKELLLELPRLLLSLSAPAPGRGEAGPQSPSSTRSFASARSGRSARSMRSPTPVRAVPTAGCRSPKGMRGAAASAPCVAQAVARASAAAEAAPSQPRADVMPAGQKGARRKAEAEAEDEKKHDASEFTFRRAGGSPLLPQFGILSSEPPPGGSCWT